MLGVFQYFDGKLQLIGVWLLLCHYYNAQGSKRGKVERRRETELANKKGGLTTSS